MKTELCKHYESLAYQQKEKLEREKLEFCDNAIKERDAQIKTLIDKLYDDCRNN